MTNDQETQILEELRTMKIEALLNSRIELIEILEDFRELVRSMRDAQKQYFKTRDRKWLNSSKEFEKAVDKALEASKQGELL